MAWSDCGFSNTKQIKREHLLQDDARSRETRWMNASQEDATEVNEAFLSMKMKVCSYRFSSKIICLKSASSIYGSD